MTIRIHILINGKVQQVFFRQSLKATCIKNNVTGWVKNLQDGRVESTLEGSDLDIMRVVDWCSVGPTNSRVEYVDVRHEHFTGEFNTFEVLY